MNYHAWNISEDGDLRSPTHGFAFRYIEERCPVFKKEPHNVRLSLDIDGVNPFGEIMSIYVVWPIFSIKNITLFLEFP
jgi:hypothetical protein